MQLSFAQLVGALAAGNLAMSKPSELTRRLSARLAPAVGKYFSPTELAVVIGGPEIGQRFVALGFDHLRRGAINRATKKLKGPASRDPGRTG